jgi:hypothetical protein
MARTAARLLLRTAERTGHCYPYRFDKYNIKAFQTSVPPPVKMMQCGEKWRFFIVLIVIAGQRQNSLLFTNIRLTYMVTDVVSAVADIMFRPLPAWTSVPPPSCRQGHGTTGRQRDRRAPRPDPGLWRIARRRPAPDGDRPGVSLEQDILARMDVTPAIAADLREMDSRIFRDAPMGIKEELLSRSKK